MGAATIEVKDMSIDEESIFEGLSAKTKDWLKTHTVEDLRNLVFEMYDDGEDVSQMVGLVSDLEYFAHETSPHQGQTTQYDMEKVEKEIEEVFY